MSRSRHIAMAAGAILFVLVAEVSCGSAKGTRSDRTGGHAPMGVPHLSADTVPGTIGSISFASDHYGSLHFRTPEDIVMLVDSEEGVEADESRDDEAHRERVEPDETYVREESDNFGDGIYAKIADFEGETALLRSAAAVGRLQILHLDGTAHGCTATLVDHNLLLTNHHCFPGRVAEALIDMRYDRNSIQTIEEAGRLAIDPVAVEFSHELDFALIRVVPEDAERLSRLHPVPLAGALADGLSDLIVIHHPRLQSKRISDLQCRPLPDVSAGSARMLHTCATSAGSSGAPMFDLETGAVVALHRAGSPDGNEAVPIGAIAAQSPRVRAITDSGRDRPRRPLLSSTCGRARGCSDLAHRLERGANSVGATRARREGCRQGEGRCCYELAYGDRAMRGVRGEYAHFLMRRACEANFLGGCIESNHLDVLRRASTFDERDDVDLECADSVELLASICEQGGAATACRYAGRHLASATCAGTPADPRRASAMYLRGCPIMGDGKVSPLDSDVESCRHSGGQAREHDREAAEVRLRFAAGRGDSTALRLLSGLVETDTERTHLLRGACYGDGNMMAPNILPDGQACIDLARRSDCNAQCRASNLEQGCRSAGNEEACARWMHPEFDRFRPDVRMLFDELSAQCRHLDLMESCVGAAAILSFAVEHRTDDQIATLLDLSPGADAETEAWVRALNLLEPAVARGVLIATRMQATILQNVEFVFRRPEYAARLLRISCDGGHMQSCTDLGVLYEHGIGVEQLSGRAAVLFELACEGGDGAGCHNLGLMYEFGDNVERNYERADALFREACLSGQAAACNIIATRRLERLEEIDLARTVALARQMCDRDSSPGCYFLGLLYQQGHGVELVDYALVIQTLRAACASGNETACSSLRRDPQVPHLAGSGPWPDASAAADLFREACDSGNQFGCYQLGMLYRREQAVQRDHREAATRLGHACRDGEVAGCYVLGLMHMSGEGAEFDLARATALYRHACTAGLEHACSAFRDLTRHETTAVEICENGNIVGCTQFAWELMSGTPPHTGRPTLFDTPRDDVGAARTSLAACRANVDAACANLGMVFWSGRTPDVDIGEIQTELAAACERNTPADGACVGLAALYETRTESNINNADLALMYRRACEHAEANPSGDHGAAPAACWRLGRMLRDGHAEAQDGEDARALMQLACDFEVYEACFELSSEEVP